MARRGFRPLAHPVTVTRHYGRGVPVAVVVGGVGLGPIIPPGPIVEQVLLGPPGPI